MDTDKMLLLENQLCFPLYAASRKVTGLYTPFLKPLGLTYTQYIAFMALWEKDNVPVSDLCERLYLDSGTLTPLLKTMEKKGYIVRTRDTKDERKVYIKLTEEGINMKEKVKEVPMGVGSCVKLDANDAKELYRILYKLIDSEA